MKIIYIYKSYYFRTIFTKAYLNLNQMDLSIIRYNDNEMNIYCTLVTLRLILLISDYLNVNREAFKHNKIQRP